MADIDKRGDKWLARWRDADGKQRARRFDRKRDAEHFLDSVRADLRRGTYVDPRAGAITLREYVEQEWLPAQIDLRPNTVETYTSHLNRWVLPLLGGRHLGSIKRTDAQHFVNAVNAKVAPSTTHTVYAVLSSVMSAAVEDGRLGATPCQRIRLPEIRKRVLEPLPAAAVLALAASIAPRYELSVWLGAGLGLRLGEATGLTAGNVDFLRRQARVVQQMQNCVLSPLKTRASQRVIPADDLVLGKVTEHMQRWKPGGDGVLITNRLGRPVQRGSFGDGWREAVAAARTCGKPPGSGRRKECADECSDPAHCLPKGTRFHDLRHFYASTLIAAGTHPKVVQARLGHATMAETMDTYGHLFPEADGVGRGVFDAALGIVEADRQAR